VIIGKIEYTPPVSAADVVGITEIDVLEEYKSSNLEKMLQDELDVYVSLLAA
jgi:succinate dehydrogenase flavin-adding protein (antitoxin of CptAB toxin-antitoxin module)